MNESRMTGFRRTLPWIGLAALLMLGVPAGLALFVYSGVYDIGADAPHTKPVFWTISQLRDRSIAVRAQAISPPDRTSAGCTRIPSKIRLQKSAM